MYKIVELPLTEEKGLFGTAPKQNTGIPIWKILEIETINKDTTRVETSNYIYEIDLPISEVIKRINSL